MPNRFEWAHRAWPILTAAAKRRRTFTYEQLGERLRIGGALPVRNALWPIQDLCEEKEWPQLTSIVLNKRTRQPGAGFHAKYETLAEAHEEVFAFPWDGIPTPFSKGFVERLERGKRRGHGGSDTSDFEVPDQMVLVNGRRAFQGRFREMLLRAYDYQCALCETSLESLLLASHIVPWSADRKNRLNPRNGLLLCRTHDCLFELGVIRIAPDGSVSCPGITKKVLGRDLYYLVTKRTGTRIWMPKGHFRPEPTFFRWRLDNPGACSLESQV